MDLLRSTSSSHRRRGTAYVFMLAMSMMVAVIGLTALYASRAASRSDAFAADAQEARFLAHSALELAQQWIAQDPNWRTTRPHGVWVTDQAFAGGTFTLEVHDSNDANLADDPYESVVMTVTAKKGASRCKLQVTLAAIPKALEALKFPIHVGGQLHIRPGQHLYVGESAVSTNGSLANEGALHGSAECATASPAGYVTGSLKRGVPAKAFPAPDVPERYAAIGTIIDPGTSLERRVLGPGYNPFGQPNANGVYVVRPDGDLTVKNSRILGTLVVLLRPGRKLRIENSVRIDPAKSDWPALIVRGDAELLFTSSNTPLSEPEHGVNFNPIGAPINGLTDSDRADFYRSRIRGLIHVAGKLDLRNDGIIQGVILCESTTSPDALATDTREIFYDPEVYKNPPRHYTESVVMSPVRGSYRRLAD